jgi:hypothetical protein
MESGHWLELPEIVRDQDQVPGQCVLRGDRSSPDFLESFEDFGRSVLQGVDTDVRIQEVDHESRFSR